jgi:replication factor C large subunit
MLEEFAESKYPMVFSANDAWDPKLSSLRQKCTLLEFKRINSSTVKKVLKEIASAEGRPESLAEEIASKSGGDLRSAILDLQANELVVSTAEREREDKPFEVVRNVLKARSFAEALAAAETSDLDLDALFLWIDENIPMEYEEKAEVAEAMHWVFRARLFFERASEGQEYRLWKYARALLLAGVASSKNGEYHKFSKYQFPSFLRRMGQSRAQRQLLQSALQKGGSKLHTASRKSLSDLLLLPKETLTRAIGLSEEESKLMNEMRGRV